MTSRAKKIADLEAQIVRDQEYQQGITDAQHRYADKLRTVLNDILLLEPQMQHYQSDDDWGSREWDYSRIHRAAEHIRNQEAAASVGYTEDCVCDPQPTQRGLYIVDPEPAA